jgi:hypothetical protein
MLRLIMRKEFSHKTVISKSNFEMTGIKPRHLHPHRPHAPGTGVLRQLRLAAAMPGGSHKQSLQVWPTKARHGGAKRRGGHLGQHLPFWRKTQQAPAFVLG